MIGNKLAVAGTIAALAFGAFGTVAGYLALNRESQDQTQISHDQSVISTLTQQANTMRAQLNSTSTTGDLITCSDLHTYEGKDIMSVSVSGTDAYGNFQSYNGDASQPNPWLPSHCYKP